MKALRLRNIRSLADTGDIALKPITLFLGQNSSGKSTALRSLPLLMQSVRTRSNAPVLWYGDLVDFGSAREVRSTFAPDQPIEFELDLGPLNVFRSRYYYYATRFDNIKTNARFSISLNESDGKTRLKKFKIRVDEDDIEVEIDGRGTANVVLVNGQDFTRLFSADKYKFSTSELVPQMINRGPQETTRPYYPSHRRGFDAAEREIRKFFGDRLPARVRDSTILSIMHKISYRSGENFVQSIHDAGSGLKSMKVLVDKLQSAKGRQDFQLIRALFMLWELPEVLEAIEHKVNTTFRTVSYVGPSRATGERYYRMQELAVDQIDPQGRNLAMFLNSLSAHQQRQFSDWLLEAVGYAIQVERSTGHIQLHLREQSSDRFYNIADMGYGFSQVLPIMAQVWARQARTGPSVGSTMLVAMEQPELHLHPAYQAKLGDIFARSISTKSASGDARRDIRFIIETHSEALINRIGELIFQHKLSASDVALYIFEKASNVDATNIRTVNFEDDGTLSNWPVGFFSPTSK